MDGKKNSKVNRKMLALLALLAIAFLANGCMPVGTIDNSGAVSVSILGIVAINSSTLITLVVILAIVLIAAYVALNRPRA